jgi:ParB-like chromosome segregation protein Spo0J
VVDPSFGQEENVLPDTSWDEEFARRLFGDLNHSLLELPDDGNIITLSESDEEEEVREEITVDAKAAPTSTLNSPAPFVSAADAANAHEEVQDDNSDIVLLVVLRLPRQKGCLQEACF